MIVHILSESEGNIAIIRFGASTWLWEYKIPEIPQHHLPQGLLATCCFQETPGNQYSVWYNNYLIKGATGLPLSGKSPFISSGLY